MQATSRTLAWGKLLSRPETFSRTSYWIIPKLNWMDVTARLEGQHLSNEIATRLDDGSLLVELIVDDADRYSRFKMKHELTHAPFDPGEVWIPLLVAGRREAELCGAAASGWREAGVRKTRKRGRSISFVVAHTHDGSRSTSNHIGLLVVLGGHWNSR
jgi:hypothetical protein